MNTTPNTRQLRPRHIPTPKMSERKKDLFGGSSRSSLMNLVIDEDSDLGPINPLEYSSSPKSYDRPIELTKHLKDRRTDFSNLMEQLSPAIKNSCRISQSDDSPKRISQQLSLSNETTEAMIIDDRVLEKEKNTEELLKTPALGSSTTVPRISFRKSQNTSDCSDGTVSPKSRRTMHRRNVENKKSDVSDSPKAKASLTFGEISAKSFYGTSNVTPAIKRSPVERLPIAIKTSRKRGATLELNRRHPNQRSGARKPILGSIRKLNHKFKVTKKKVDHLKKHNQLLDKIEKVLDTSRLKMYFKDLQSSSFDKELISGRSRNILKESIKSPNKSLQSLLSKFDDERVLSEEDELEEENERAEQENVQAKRKFFKSKSTGTQNRYQVAKGISATVKRGHGIKLLSPPKKKCKKDDGYDELLLIQQEVRDIVQRLSSSNTGAASDTKSSEHARNVQTEKLHSCDMEMQNDNTIYDKYRKLLPYNTTDQGEIKRQETVLEILIENGICHDQNFKIFISEYEHYKDEAESILNNLFDISVSPDMNDEEQMWTSQDDVAISKHPTLSQSHRHDAIVHESSTTSQEKREFHPIFYKDHRRSDAKKDLINVPIPKPFKWIPISDKQLQIDAGQKEFGSKNCSECGMFYTLHDPEDEILHQKFHNNMMGVLAFKGWTEENLVANIEEWGDKGRIIWVNIMDIKKKVNRVVEMLEIVNNDLGFANVELQQSSIVYLAISRKRVIGVCVAEPLNQAHPMYTENNVEYIDLKNVIPVKCGISRIWVTPQFRRYGVATRLIQTVCSHFVRGYTLAANEIAFSTPTVMGKQFAQTITQNVLVYDQVQH